MFGYEDELHDKIDKLETELAKYKALAELLFTVLDNNTICGRPWCHKDDGLCKRCAALAEFRDATKEKT